jgi:predicted TIM-barrel fold metal-dependent hydrolase
MGPTRRQALVSLAAGGLAARPRTGSPVFDAHVHVWAPPDRYTLAPGFKPSDLWFPSFTAEQLLEHAAPAGVTRINLVQMTWYGTDHTYIADLIARRPDRFVGTGIVPAITDAAGPAPDETMVALAKRGIVAFRVRGRSTRPPIGDGDLWMDHPGYEKMFAAAAAHRLGLSFLMSAPDIPELDRMCARFPEAPVIIDHLCLIGGKGVFPEEQMQALCGMARHKNVMLKVGAFYGLGAKKPPYLDLLPLIERAVKAFGPERCMWESDAPLQARAPQSYQASVDLIREHARFLSPADREQILFKTADDFFFRRRHV